MNLSAPYATWCVRIGLLGYLSSLAVMSGDSYANECGWGFGAYITTIGSWCLGVVMFGSLAIVADPAIGITSRARLLVFQACGWTIMMVLVFPQLSYLAGSAVVVDIAGIILCIVTTWLVLHVMASETLGLRYRARAYALITAYSLLALSVGAGQILAADAINVPPWPSAEPIAIVSMLTMATAVLRRRTSQSRRVEKTDPSPKK